jgi:hypothetical protein
VAWADREQTGKAVVITILGDNLGEADETVLLSLSNPTGGASLGLFATATLVIGNDDALRRVRIDVTGAAGAVSVGADPASARPVPADFTDLPAQIHLQLRFFLAGGNG